MSSSLAGALVPPEPSASNTPFKQEQDIKFEPQPPHEAVLTADVKTFTLSQPDSHSEDEPEDEKDKEMADLFGNDDVEDSRPEGSAASPGASERVSSPERERRRALEYEEEDLPAEIAVEVKEAEVAFPNLPVPRSSSGDNWVIRMPNYVKVDSKPFHPETYMGPEHEDEETQQAETLREKSMTIKLRVENTVRWRWTKDASSQDKRQSNSRVIRWSDGSLSLRLGKELFDINQSIDTSGGVPRQSFGGPQGSQSQPQSQTPLPSGKSQGLTYLVAQHKRSQVLQAEAVITGYMTLRPMSMQSDTHQMLVRAVGQKHNKVARLRMAPDPTTDPEREKMELMKLSVKNSKSKKKQGMEDEFGPARSRRRSSRKSRHADVWSDDEDDVGPTYASDDEDHPARPGEGKSAPDDRKGDYQHDDFVVTDESDDGGFESGVRKRKRRDDMMEEDALDRLDAKIEEQDAKKRRRRESAGSKEEAEGDADDTMDVESEEEDEFRVRPTGRTGSRRRLNLDDDEEE